MNRKVVDSFLTVSVSCILGVAFAGCGGSSKWWMFQAGPAHSGLYPERSPIAPLHLKWDKSLLSGTDSLTPPVFGEDKIFIGSNVGKLYALSPSNGHMLWSFSAASNNEFYGAAAAASNRVYAATLGTNAHVYALKQANGALVWKTPLSLGSRASVAVGLGRVFVNSDQHKLYALHQGTGAILWSANTSPGASSQESSPAFGFGKVFVGSDDGLYAFDPVSGSQLWKFPLTGGVGFSSAVLLEKVPAGTSPLVYISTNDRKLYAVKVSDGTQAWSYTGSATLAFSSVAVAEGKVFLFDYNKISALDTLTGTVVWTQTVSAIPRHSPAISYGVLYYSDNSFVRGIRTTNGTPVWDASIPGNGNANAPGEALAIEFGMVVVPNKGHVYAFTGS